MQKQKVQKTKIVVVSDDGYHNEDLNFFLLTISSLNVLLLFRWILNSYYFLFLYFCCVHGSGLTLWTFC